MKFISYVEETVEEILVETLLFKLNNTIDRGSTDKETKLFWIQCHWKTPYITKYNKYGWRLHTMYLKKLFK